MFQCIFYFWIRNFMFFGILLVTDFCIFPSVTKSCIFEVMTKIRILELVSKFCIFWNFRLPVENQNFVTTTKFVIATPKRKISFPKHKMSSLKHKTSFPKHKISSLKHKNFQEITNALVQIVTKLHRDVQHNISVFVLNIGI